MIISMDYRECKLLQSVDNNPRTHCQDVDIARSDDYPRIFSRFYLPKRRLNSPLKRAIIDIFFPVRWSYCFELKALV
jgi:hypothetical protein